jgi:hypothetical protein
MTEEELNALAEQRVLIERQYHIAFMHSALTGPSSWQVVKLERMERQLLEKTPAEELEATEKALQARMKEIERKRWQESFKRLNESIEQEKLARGREK